MARRRRLPAELTAEAREGMGALANRNGVTMTAMLEILGLFGRANRPLVWDEIIAEARELDLERRSRR